MRILLAIDGSDPSQAAIRTVSVRPWPAGSTVRVADSLRTPQLSSEKSVRRGNARAEILDEAEAWDADLIVIGSHGRTGITRWVLGSVAESVVRYAPCSVEVARERSMGFGGGTSS